MQSFQVVKCPYCGAQHRMVKPAKKLKDYEMYSDGKTVSSELNEALEVSRCSKCNEFFWIEDAAVEVNPVEEELPIVRSLSIIEYVEMLTDNTQTVTPDEEEILRMELLWAFNDRVRQGKSLFESEDEKTIWLTNMNALSELLDESDVYSRMIKAEIAREQGNFELAEKLLSSIKEAQLMPIKKMMLNAISHDETEVFKIEM
ncbi:hypothetical protein [uncultured Acetobacteroides sp.]|uniref:hypothetical protein n=1 Tax=uncultured Acetobacteroides sp. TaxID=1760811 RepID=UPI0029F51F05|nr:hypothetical protein [uncultured Acetobacteroides sp.]